MEQHQNQQQSLKCPRCDSSNTKFCYYNNYSLSQPRHFCKACKRYWTRGGSLRKVPVGGGCRKNKRVKMLPNATTTTTHVALTSQPVVNNPNPNSNPNFDNLSSFHGLIPQNHDYQRSFNSGCDFSQHQISNLGLGFSSSNATAASVENRVHNSSLFLSRSSSDPTMASLLNSGFQQPQRYMDWSNNFEEQNNDDRLEAMASSDPNSLIWNTSSGGGGGWFDHTSNIEYSSLASLI